MPNLFTTIQTRYDLGPLTGATRLSGGEWKTMWRVDGIQESYVVSLSHPTTSVESLAYEHRLLDYLHQQLPQVPAPLLARDGSSYFLDQGRIVSLLPMMPGEPAEGGPAHLLAAHFLAEFHQVGMRYPDQSPRPDVPAWHAWDWCATTWPIIQQMLTTTPQTTDPTGQRFWQSCGEWAEQIADRRLQIAEARMQLQRWLANQVHGDVPLTSGLVHDDYHGDNLLIAGTTVTALLDWDGCHPDWLLWDVSNLLWEFCSDDENHTLDVTAAQACLDAYMQAGGPISAEEVTLVVPFIRCRRMIEVLTALRGIATGAAWDESPDYLVHNLLALEALRQVVL